VNRLGRELTIGVRVVRTAAVIVAAACGMAATGSTASAEVSNLSTHWLVQSSANTSQYSGKDVSMPGFGTSSWMPEATDDAGGGLTEIGALGQNGLGAPGVPNAKCSSAAQTPGDPDSLPAVYFSDNIRQCWGQEQGEGRAVPTNALFAVPWWFRSDFTTPQSFASGQHARLIVNGIVGQADIWVNGSEVADQQTVEGDYTQYTFDISGLVHAAGQTNSIALEVYPNQPNTMFTLDNVDWTQIPPDHNTGIQFPVQIDYYGAVALSNSHVVENNAPAMSSSALTLKGDVTNSSSSPQVATVMATVKDPQGNVVTTAEQTVTVPANTTQTVVFDPNTYAALNVNHPQLWWPWQMGGQPLYTLTMNVSVGGSVSDTAEPETFGIRTVTSYLTPPSALWVNGIRQFAVNGKPFVWRTGGWGEDEFLRYSSQDAANQIALMRSLGLQGIRTEGKEMPDDFYEQLDKAGMIVDGGFQCCDSSWQPSSSGAGVTANDYHVEYLTALRIGERLRNHPSVFNYSWSDNPPIKEQEAVSLQGFSDADFDVPFISSADENSSPILGPAGEKEGPYDYGAPSYWYSDTSNSDGGNSTGFDSESSPGDTVPTLDSLNRFLSTSDQATLGTPTASLPNGRLSPGVCWFSTNQYHMNWETGCPTTGFNFGTMNNFNIALYNRYGSWLPSSGTPQATGNTTAGSVFVTNPTSTGGSPFVIGSPVTGSGIPAGTTLQDATTTGTATTSSGSNQLTNVTTLSGQFAVGSTVTGTGIPSGTTITVINGNAFTISANATSSGSNRAITGSAVWTLSQAATATGTAVALSGQSPAPLSGGAHVAPGLNQYVEEAQPLMYEADRAQFEANIDHSTNYPNPSTGTDFWLLNHAFPTLLWGLYNKDYDQNGGFFGAKKADEPLHALYVYDNSAVTDNNTVTLDNLTGSTESGVSVESKVYGFGGTVLDDQTASGITLPSQGVMNAVIHPNVPAATTPPTPAQTYFVELIVRQNGIVVDRNVYWVSTQQDQNTAGNPVPTFANANAFANLTELQSLPATTLSVTAASHPQGGLPAGADTVSDVTITNTGSTVAYFVRVDLRRGTAAGAENVGDNEVLPVTYSDNDITLWPGESQTVEEQFNSADLHGATPVDSVSGWNVPYFDVLDPASAAADQAEQAAESAPGVTSFGLANGTPAHAAGATPGRDNAPATMNALRRRVTSVSLRAHRANGRAVVRIACHGASGATCSGALKLSVTVRRRVHGHWRWVAVGVGRHPYSVGAGESRTVRVRLPAVAQRGKRGSKLLVGVVAGR
jgi:hypothetical protein